MKLENRSKTIILVPYPAQGHVNPMMKVALAMLNLGFEPVIIIPDFIHQRIITSLDPKCRITFMSISDGLENDIPRDFFAIEKAMENTIPPHLESLVHKIDEEYGEVMCMIVDLLASSAIQVAHRCGVPVAGFWPVMLAAYQLIESIPDMVSSGLISETGCPQHPGPICSLRNTPSLSTADLPWLIGTPAARKARFNFWTRTMDRSRNLKWLLMNSFSDQEHCLDDIKPHQNRNSRPHVLQIGSLGNNEQSVIKNPSFWAEDMSSLQWLDEKKPNTVIYISFGSWVSPFGEGKVRCLALALEAIGQPFIWVLGPAWREGLPGGYVERVSKQAKVVSWAPQVEVLKHQAVGCYLTHCGWNSTMEAIQCQKRLLCYPIAGDQFVNCAYIVEKWKIGVRINDFGQKHVEESLRKVMEDSGMDSRLMWLYERTMGEEAKIRAMANVKTLIDDLQKIIPNQSLGTW
ncbi:UDP-glycosyltransferase 82A1 [Ricinus communis]|uniref:UDP-glycosyltransferase 82A1 n=1 Tax=Ricinus communis TaxID=3988 RepID=UPI00201A9A63|nr:UDP-glycosyltransferase 82A1 [Ricinus communis]